MSTRWYPIYKRGNPQLRVFMTDFWMKMVRNDQKPTPPSNVVTFRCSMEMTKHDIKNYLTKIYNVPVVDVHTEVRLGEFHQDTVKKYVKKKDDYRVAIVTMVSGRSLDPFLFAPIFLIYSFEMLQPKEVTFEFPEIFDQDEKDDDMSKARKSLKEQAELYQKFLKRNADSRGSPPWFSF